MNLEEIINAAVEKRISEIINAAFSHKDESGQPWDKQNAPSRLEDIVAREIEKIARGKTIRATVVESLQTGLVQFEIKTFATAVVPRI